jgi:hypothetical protein
MVTLVRKNTIIKAEGIRAGEELEEKESFTHYCGNVN